MAQKNKISGTVVDRSGLPLPGVTVSVKNTTQILQTETDGKFSIMAAPNDVLLFSFIGMKNLEVLVTSKTTYKVTLEDDVSALDEVVVVGYGVSKKSDVTGSITSVSSKELNSRPVTDALQGIQGKAAGVDITSSERPGTLGQITVRGVRSLSATNNPLYVVDGIPLTTGGIENINPIDIESIDILKDASATAIYGSRGANGVVIITTKRGKAGSVTLNLNSSFTMETLENRAALMNAGEFIEFRRWAKYYSNPAVFPRGDQPTQANDADIFLASSDPAAYANILKGWQNGTFDASKVQSTNWIDLVTRTGINQQHTISASGGSDKVKSYGSFGFLDNKGTVLGQSYKRYSGKLSVDINGTDWLTYGGTLNTSYGVNEYGQSPSGRNSLTNTSGLYESARAIFTYAVPYDSDGNRVEFPGGDIAVKTIVDEEKYSQDQRINFRGFGSLYSELNFGKIFKSLEGLKYRLNFGPDLSMNRDGLFLDAKSVIRSGSSYAALNKFQSASYTLDNLLYYNKSIKKHSFGITLLQTQTKYKYETNSMAANNIPFASQKWNALNTSNVTLSSYNSDITEKQLNSYLARVNYDFSNRFLITASARWDGASQLSGDKWAFFPSAAIGWRLDQEKFMSKLNWLDQLKLRVGVGVTGNAAVDPYSTKDRLSNINYPIGATLTPGTEFSSTLGNKDLTWEKTRQYNFGMDYSINSGKFSGSLDYYTSSTTDLLLQRTILSVSGFTTVFANVGETASQGVDFNINSTNINTDHFKWSTGFNASWQDNHIVSLANGNADDLVNNWFIGKSQGVIYGYKSNGIWQESDAAEIAKFNANGQTFSPGLTRPADQNGDYKIDPNNDRVIIGNTIPKYIVGLTNTFTYKGVELSVFLYGRLGYLYNTGGENQSGRYNQRQINYYTINNPNSEYQKPIYSAGTGDPYYNSLGYKDGSFIKIRNISLGYNIPDKTSKRLGLSNARIYAQATNPGMLYSNIDFIDLDLRSSAFNRGFTFGLSLNF
ncbi:MAG: TonB-dependent receptor [Candidatus Dojkabacteria bacterium]